MNRAIPGTVLTGTAQDLLHIDQMLDSLFLAGGMTRSQVVTITGLEPYMVQNWVKRGACRGFLKFSGVSSPPKRPRAMAISLYPDRSQ